MKTPLLSVKDLNIYFHSDNVQRPIHAIRDLSFSIMEGEMLGVVGESGSGKSITNLALMGLLGESAKISAMECKFNNKNLLSLTQSQWQSVRGGEIAMIFQDPMTALNPFLTVEFQLVEVILAHNSDKLNKRQAIDKALDLLNQVGISSPKERLKSYPFELSGGMAQRVMIAMAISTNPKLLIADEPTTALDVTIQKQILTLIKELQIKKNMAVILVTHDLGVVSEFSERTQVMYAGEIIESGSTHQIINHPRHPYTLGLLSSRPGAIARNAKTLLPSIGGIVPAFHQRPNGCQFNPRCQFVKADCQNHQIEFIEGSRCLYPLSVALERSST